MGIEGALSATECATGFVVIWYVCMEGYGARIPLVCIRNCIRMREFRVC